MQTIKTNTRSNAGRGVPTITTAIVAPADAMRTFVVAATSASEAAIKMVSAGASYLVIACLLQADDKQRLSLADATKEMTKQIVSNKGGVGAEMLKRYVQACRKLYDKLTDKGKYPAVVQAIGKAKTANGAAEAVESFVSGDLGATSLNQLRTKLGINTGHKGPAEPAKPADRVKNLLQLVSKPKGKAEGASTPAAVIKTVANAVSDPFALARQSLERVFRSEQTKPEDVEGLIKWLNSELDAMLARAEQTNAKPRKASRKATVAKLKADAAKQVSAQAA